MEWYEFNFLTLYLFRLCCESADLQLEQSCQLQVSIFTHTSPSQPATFAQCTSYKVVSFHHMVKYGVRSPKSIWAPVYSCTYWLRSRNSPPPTSFGLIYEGAIGQLR
jgi:hypothetical protein